MPISDLDKIHSQRIAPIGKKWRDYAELPISDIFVSSRVIEELSEEKAVLGSFRSRELLSLLPFVPSVYVVTCPLCIDKENLPVFRKLTESGLVVPMLAGPYKEYPDEVVELLTGVDHISYHEFSFYRFAMVMRAHQNQLCRHCVKEREKVVLEMAKALQDKGVRKRYIEQVYSNLFPFVDEDDKFLEQVERAVKLGQVAQIRRLYRLSYSIRGARTAAAFHASQVLSANELSSLPSGLTTSGDEARAVALQLKALVAEGLRLRFPENLPIDHYIELVKDYQPRLAGLNRSILSSASQDGEVSIGNLQRTIGAFNRDIERIKGLRRHMILEALVGFAASNPALVAGGFVAGTLGLTGSLLGCAAVPVGVAADLVKKAGKIKPNEAASRVVRKLRRDIQPSIDRLIARYTSSSTTAINVLTIRQEVDRASKLGQGKPDSST